MTSWPRAGRPPVAARLRRSTCRWCRATPAASTGGWQGVSGGAAFLLCRRAAKMNRHAGQWALPGGRLDADETVEQAAIRETARGARARPGPATSVLGRLDDYPTRSGFVISPVVVWGGVDVEMHPDPGRGRPRVPVGLHELCRDDSPRFVTIPESDRPVVQIPLGGRPDPRPDCRSARAVPLGRDRGPHRRPGRPLRATRLRLEVSLRTGCRALHRLPPPQAHDEGMQSNGDRSGSR